MPSPSSPGSWHHAVLKAVAVVLIVAFGARWAAAVLEPLVPSFIAIAVLLGIGWFVLRRR